MIVPPRAARICVVVATLAATINLGVAVVLALHDPRRASDLSMMAGWCRDWLLHGYSLYTGADAVADYPPNAIVLLSPIAIVPRPWLTPLWIAGALPLTAILSWLVMRIATDRHRIALVVPALLALCWAAPRTLLQFTVLSLTLAIAAAWLADSRRGAAGVALGLALFKPHVAGPIALWMLVSGRGRQLLTAVSVVGAGWLIYDLRIGESPLTTGAGLWQVWRSEYAGDAGLVGRTSLRAWTQAAARDPASGDLVWLAVAVALLLAIVAIAMRDRSRPLADGGLAVPAMFCLWSLLVIYHNGNNMILMLPAFAFIWFSRSRAASAARWLPIVVLQAALMYDVPLRLAGLAAAGGWSGAIVRDFDRLVVLATLIYVSVLWCRLTQPARRDRSLAAAAH